MDVVRQGTKFLDWLNQNLTSLSLIIFLMCANGSIDGYGNKSRDKIWKNYDYDNYGYDYYLRGNVWGPKGGKIEMTGVYVICTFHLFRHRQFMHADHVTSCDNRLTWKSEFISLTLEWSGASTFRYRFLPALQAKLQNVRQNWKLQVIIRSIS